MEPTLKFQIVNHAFPRWNTRVGPVINDISRLAETISVAHAQRRVKLYYKQCIGVIDDDILFTFETKGKKDTIIITTFYGRVSFVPYLADFEMFRKYNKKSNDTVRLEQPIEELNKQSLVIQKEIMHFQGDYQKYVLEKFESREGEMIYITVTEGPHVGTIVEINPNDVNADIVINKRCLGALKEIGYEFYVEQYIEASLVKKALVRGA
jgi:hypothetical protein